METGRNTQFNPNYIGVKMVAATPMNAEDAGRYLNRPINTSNSPDGEGYLVTYPDGYMSWCPKRQFEEANRPLNGMTFGHAIEAAKKGYKIARRGWNGKNMFLFIREGRQITGDPSSPMGGDFESLPHFCMRTADGKCCVGWLASQTDMLSDDWVIVS